MLVARGCASGIDFFIDLIHKLSITNQNTLSGFYLNLLINGVCPVCLNGLNGVVFNDNFIYDYLHAELVCKQCGAVVSDSTIPTLKDIEYTIKSESKLRKSVKEPPEDIYITEIKKVLESF